MKSDESINDRHDWLLLGAKEKAKSVLNLVSGLNVQSVIEVGCGTGAVLETLDKHGFAKEYYALEPAEELYDFLIKRNEISRLIASEASPVETSSLSNSRYDLAILSHVIEHVEDPAKLLIDTMKIATYVVVEVPLEGNAMGNLRAAVKKRINGLPRYNNPSGHFQFFSRSDIHLLAHWCGGEVLESRLYVPKDQMRKAMSSDSLKSRMYSSLIYALSTVLGEWIWGRFYHGHYAVIIRQRAAFSQDERSQWPASNYYENADGRSK